MPSTFGKLTDLSEYRERLGVFADRTEAGQVLARMLEAYRDTGALVLAIPSGGLPVAIEIARGLGLPLDVAVVSKITLPWKTESGYGAVAFDGTVQLNDELLPYLDLTAEEVRQGIARTTEKVARRLRALRGERAMPNVEDRPVILVDDGVASGFTTRVAIAALRKAGASHIILATPTAHQEALRPILAAVDAAYCPNVRSGRTYAVAAAYRHWDDVAEDEAARTLKEANE